MHNLTDYLELTKLSAFSWYSNFSSMPKYEKHPLGLVIVQLYGKYVN